MIITDMPFLRSVCVLIITISFLGCGGGKPSYMDPVENVIIIVLDTFRANHIGFMGYDRPTTPNLDQFARKSVIFENSYVTRSLTLPSFTALWSGLHTTRNGIFQNAWPLANDLHLMVEDFNDAGYTTLGTPASDILSARYGIARGFDIYDEPIDPPRMAPEGIAKMTSLIEQSEGPYFLFYHFWETHSPYTPDDDTLAMFGDINYSGPMDGEVETLNGYNLGQIQLDQNDILHAIDLYDAEMRMLDDSLGELFEYFESEGLMDNSVIVITADHGESLGEGHFFQHLRDTEIELRVPLLFHFPNDYGAGKRIRGLVENTDIMPTVMNLLGMDVPEDLDGNNLVPMIDGDAISERSVLLSVGTTHQEKYLYSEWDGTTRRRVNIDIQPDTVDLDDETRERLEALGYIQ